MIDKAHYFSIFEANYLVISILSLLIHENYLTVTYGFRHFKFLSSLTNGKLTCIPYIYIQLNKNFNFQYLFWTMSHTPMSSHFIHGWKYFIALCAWSFFWKMFVLHVIWQFRKMFFTIWAEARSIDKFTYTKNKNDWSFSIK